MALLSHSHNHAPTAHHPHGGIDLLRPLRHWLDHLPVQNRRLSHLICRVIPCCCPFERDVVFLGRTVHIPAMCELNPVYSELVGLRFRALSYLADECEEDVTRYVC